METAVFVQQGILISVKTVFSAMALLTHMHFVTCCKSRFFFASLLHRSKWLFLFVSSEPHLFFFLIKDYSSDVPSNIFIICFSFTSSIGLVSINRIIMRTRILNRSAVRADLFQAAPNTLPLTFLKIKLVCNRSTLLSSQVGTQHPPIVPQQDTKSKLRNCSLSFICKGYYSAVETIRLTWQKAVKLSYDDGKWVVKLCWKFRRDE